MDQAFRERIMPSQWVWCIVNNLDKFNDKPDLILNIISKVKRIEDHRILSTFSNLFNSIEKYYDQNSKFPDTNWLKLNFKGNMTIVITKDEFSMQIYESLDKYIDQELLKQEVSAKFVEKENPTLNDIRDLTRNLAKFTDKAVDLPEETKEDLINSYDAYSANYKGLKTHIRPLDNAIGVLGYQSLSVFAAPSGHGKSTFAFSVAYYAAIHGYCVDYLSFEIPKEHAWFNMVSIQSEDTEVRLPSNAMKENLLTEAEKEAFKEHMKDLLARIKKSNGYLNIIDQTTASINTFEGLCAKLESIAEKRGRKADLIVVDNIDNFQTLKSSERDEATKINNYIVSLDAYSKKYYNGEGTTILLLSQVNRPALKKLHTTEGEDGNERKTKIDVSCIQKYNALYEKATCVLVGYADEVLRAGDTMKVYPVKLRNRPIPLKPVQLNVKFGFSKVKGEFPLDECETPQEREKMVDNYIAEVVGISEEEMAEIQDDLQDFMDD